MDNSLYTGIMPVTITRDEAKTLVMKRFEPECGSQFLAQVKKQLSGIKLQYYPYAIFKGDTSVKLNGKLEQTKVDVAHGSEDIRTTDTYEYVIDMEGSCSLEGVAVPLFNDGAFKGISNVDTVDLQQAGPFSLEMLENISLVPVVLNELQAQGQAGVLAKEALTQKMLSKYTGKYTGSDDIMQSNMEPTGKILVPIYTVEIRLFNIAHTIYVNASTGKIYDTEPEVNQPGVAQGYLFHMPYFKKAFRAAVITVLVLDVIWLIYYLAS